MRSLAQPEIYWGFFFFFDIFQLRICLIDVACQIYPKNFYFPTLLPQSWLGRRFWPIFHHFEHFQPKTKVYFATRRSKCMDFLKLRRNQLGTTVFRRNSAVWQLKIGEKWRKYDFSLILQPIFSWFFLVKWDFLGMGGKITFYFSKLILVKTFLTFSRKIGRTSVL